MPTSTRGNLRIFPLFREDFQRNVSNRDKSVQYLQSENGAAELQALFLRKTALLNRIFDTRCRDRFHGVGNGFEWLLD